MRDRIPLIIDMTPGGEFTPTPKPPSLAVKVAVGAAVVAVVAGAVVVASLFLWLATLLLPLALLAAAVAYAGFRFQLWQRRR